VSALLFVDVGNLKNCHFAMVHIKYRLKKLRLNREIKNPIS
jgi:hypothetical protein